MIASQKKIIKNIAVFGSVQVFTMAIGVVRSKFAALFLGTQGVGFLGLLLSSFALITTAVNMGTPTSLVKYLSASTEETIPKKLKTARFLTFTLGVLGAVACLFFAKPLSFFSFGNQDFAWAFRLVSFAVLFKLIAIGYSSILQSQNHLKKLANANMVANILGIMATIPLYYFFNINGVVYNLVVVGLIEVAVLFFFYKNLKNKEENLSHKDMVKASREIVGDGFYYNLSSFLAILSAYLVQIFVSRQSGIEILGLYVTGTTILNTYVSVIFVAMGYDYFPRLCKVATSGDLLNSEVNHQLKVGIVIIFPVLLWLVILCPWVVQILFSKAFLGSVIFLEIAVLGIFFKLFSWTLGFVILANGGRKMILQNAVVYNTFFVILHLVGFYFFGLKGIAAAFSLYFLIHLIGNFWLTNTKLKVKISRENLNLYLFCFILLLFCIILNFIVEDSFFKSLILFGAATLVTVWAVWQFIQIFGAKK